MLVSVEQDDHPLLDYVRIQGILLVVHECFDDLLEAAQPQLFEAVLHRYQFLKEEEKLPVSL